MLENELLQKIKETSAKLREYPIGKKYWEILNELWHTQQEIHELRRKAAQNFKYYE